MDWHQLAALVTGVLTLVAVVPYVRDMLRGTTRPNLVTWGLWLIIQTIFILAQFSAGASWSVLLPLMEMLTVGVVFLLGLFGYGYKQYRKLDIACLGIALAAIVLWQLTSEPLVALFMALAADLVAGIPTLRRRISTRCPKRHRPIFWYLFRLFSVGCRAPSSTFLT